PPGPGQQGLDGVAVALDLDLDPAVGQVADPAGHAEALGLAGAGRPVADALDAARHGGPDPHGAGRGGAARAGHRRLRRPSPSSSSPSAASSAASSASSSASGSSSGTSSMSSSSSTASWTSSPA